MSFSQLILWFPEAKEIPEINVSLQSSTAALSSFFNEQKCCRDSSYKHMHSVVLSSLALSHSLFFFFNFVSGFGIYLLFCFDFKGFWVCFFITTHFFFFPLMFPNHIFQVVITDTNILLFTGQWKFILGENLTFSKYFKSHWYLAINTILPALKYVQNIISK